jgi:hypothetical protein
MSMSLPPADPLAASAPAEPDAPPAPPADTAAPAPAASGAPTPSFVRPVVAAAPPPDLGAIEVGGKELPRLAVPQTPLDAAQVAVMRLAVKGVDAVPPGLGLTDMRTEDAAVAAVAAPKLTTSTGGDTPLGKLAILKPGGSNFAPSAAFVFRTAQYAERTVIAYQNASDPAQNHLRAVDEVDGVPVPAALRGKIFAIGSPDPAIIGIEQASDNFVDQFGEMEREKATLGVDPLAAGATVIGHSEGCADAALTRRRLEEAGFGGAIGKLVTLGSGLGYDAVPDSKAELRPLTTSFSLAAPLLKALGKAPDLDALNDLDGTYRKYFPPGSGTDQLVDLSVAGVVGPPAHIVPRLGIPPFRIDDPNNIKPGIRAYLMGAPLLGEPLSPAHILGAIEGTSNDSDGLVPNNVSRAGKKFVLLDKPHDHAGLVEDPAVVDEIVKDLDG